MATGYPAYGGGYPPNPAAASYGAPPNANTPYGPTSSYGGSSYGAPASTGYPSVAPVGAGSNAAGYYAPQGYQPPSELENWFRAVDRDGSGRIDAGELNAALSSAGFRFSVGTTEVLMRRYDTDGSGGISFDEFGRMHAFLHAMQEGFRRGDRSGDGRLDGAETREAFRRSGFELSDETFQAVMRKFDRQKRGSLGFDDYMELSVFIDHVRDVFSTMDTDRDGQVTFSFESFVGAGVSFAS